ncbi:MAG: ShlB/FhaC/HecB family hemolysin secretion/activation protein [Alphaproteobacteria bacterium]|nr:ShlB/FhaC/HecB family hemolysin secretion/activation protein [Alphaproteobacteria bacterium]
MFAIGTVALCLSVPALAQQRIPGSIEPGRIEKQFEKPLVPQSVLEPVVPDTPEQAPPSNAAQIRFKLTGLVVEDSTVFKETDFLPIYQKLLGNEIALSDIYKVAAEITAMYGKAGYALSRAVVPAQKIHEGIVHLKIIEGYIDKVQVEGDAGPLTDRLIAMASNITKSRPLQASVMERYLLLANDLPGISVSSVMKPSEDNKGGATLVLVTEYKPVGANVTIDNRAARTNGPLEQNFGVTENSWAGLGERTDLRYIRGGNNELRFIDFAHQELLSTEGTKFDFTANQSHSNPGSYLKYLRMNNTSNIAGFDFTHPFIRSRAETLTGKIGFDYKNSSALELGKISSEDRSRDVYIGGSYDFADRFGGKSLANLTLTKGLGILGATEPGRLLLSRALGSSDFLKANADIVRNQSVMDKTTLVMGISGQWSANDLLSSEQFGFGGEQYGRAYDSSEIIGDNGVAGKVELQYTIDNPDMELKYFQPFIYYDLGQVWLRNALVTQKSSEFASSTGGGFRMGVTDWINGSLELDKPLTHDVAAYSPGRARDPRVFFNMSVHY